MSPSFETRFGLAEEIRKTGSGESDHRFAMVFKTREGLQFVSRELEVGWFLEREKILEEGAGLRRRA